MGKSQKAKVSKDTSNVNSIQRIRERLATIKSDEERILGTRSRLENEETRLLEQLVELKKKKMFDKERELQEQNSHLQKWAVDLSQKENKLKKSADSLASQQARIRRQEEEIKRLIDEEKEFEETGKVLLQREREIGAREAQVMKEKEEAYRKIIAVERELREKRHELHKVENKIGAGKRMRILQNQVLALQNQVLDKSKEFDRYKLRKSTELKELQEQLTRNVHNRVKRVVDKELVMKKVAEIAEVMKKDYEKKLAASGKKGKVQVKQVIKTSLDPEVKSVLNELNRLLGKVPEDEIQKFAKTPKFEQVRKIFDKYEVS
jgi:hypothetical protein